MYINVLKLIRTEKSKKMINIKKTNVFNDALNSLIEDECLSFDNIKRGCNEINSNSLF